MKFDPTKDIDKNKAKAMFKGFIEGDKPFELKGIFKSRSISQNAYLHVCITLMAIEEGKTIEEQKTDLKRECSFMRYEKNGNTYLRRTRSMDSKELGDFIDWILKFAAENNCYIPSSEDYLASKFDYDREIDRHRKYL